MKKIFCLIVCCLLLCSCGSDKKEDKAVVQSVTCSEMKELVKDGAVLVDVRTLAEYKSGHLDEAVNLPVETIILPHEKDDTDTVYAVKEAVSRGFSDFLLIGVIGDRFDHSLGNISILLMLDSLGKTAKIVDDYSEMEEYAKL